MSRPLRRILVANRGEIAVRIIRACRDLGVSPVAVFSEADRTALHVRLADEAYLLGEGPSRDSYLRIDRVIDAARKAGAGAVHPGYGFLAENADFARAVTEAGLVFIGPRAETIALMGEKTSARREAVAAGVPVVPGTLEPLAGEDAIAREAAALGFPVMLKAAAGGGGKGLRLVREASDLPSALARAQGEAKSAFGEDRVYLEKAIRRPRHIEIQVLADHHGHAVHLFERECSIQRRHQKVIEESPSPFVDADLRERMGALAVALVKRTGYVNAGTLEFLVDEDRAPWFLEMNTRLQVEHPVTEMVTGVDLVKLQIQVAAGQPLPFRQEDLVLRGHAIECRVYAEDPARGFLPSPGRIVGLRAPGGPGIRDDSGVYAGYEVPVHYDPLLSKLVAHGDDRAEAIARLRRAVREYLVVGIHTTLPLFAGVLDDPRFRAGDFDTSFLEGFALPPPEPSAIDVAVMAAALRSLRERGASALAPHSSSRPAPWWEAGLREAHRGRP